jgi:hypothetical protein
LSTPQLSLDCFLYKTKAQIKLLTDDTYFLFEQNIRGGVSFIAERHCETGFSEELQKNVHLLLLDENNL